MNKPYNIDNISSLPPHFPSMCIPRVFSNITKQTIYNVFKNLKLGYISHIDIVNKTKNNTNFNCVYIHFNKWFTSDSAVQTRIRLLNRNDVKVIYNDPWFWKVFINFSNNNNKNLPTSISTNNIINTPRTYQEQRFDYGHKQIKNDDTNNDKALDIEGEYDRPPSPLGPPVYHIWDFPLGYTIDDIPTHYTQYMDLSVDYNAQPKS